MNTDFCGFLVSHGIAVGGWLLCIYMRQREMPDKGITGPGACCKLGHVLPSALDTVDHIWP
jgi:hypothetical protein